MLWLDGTIYEGTRAPFDLADRGLLLGDGVFETALVLRGRMVWRDAHVARLIGATQRLGFAVDAGRVQAAIDGLLVDRRHGALRITVTRGSGPRGVAPPAEPKPVVFATLAPLRAVALFAPLKLHPTAIRRNETSPCASLKTLDYLDAVLASREALTAGCDEALFCNTKGKIACTSVGNVLAIIGDQLVTPPPDDGVLPGLTRRRVMERAEEVGLEPIERSLTMAELEQCRAMLVTNSLRLATPVSAVGRTVLNSSASRRAQAIIAQLAVEIRDETGVDPRLVAEG